MKTYFEDKDLINMVFEGTKKTVELFRGDPSELQETASEAWTNVTYKGINIFDPYMNVMNDAASELGIGETFQDQWEEIDPETGEEYTEYDIVTIDGQECYLGYIPSKDIFISGWDLWMGEDSPAGIVQLRFNNGQFEVIEAEKRGYGMFYGRNGEYNNLHKRYHDLVDIRLD